MIGSNIVVEARMARLFGIFESNNKDPIFLSLHSRAQQIRDHDVFA
jgi:hypothetical protein